MILFRLADLSRDEVLTVMATVGFTDDGKAKPHHAVSTLSGGWRMKLAMARAMLQRADILLLDEVSLILMNNSFANYSYVVAF
jgi:elongation factor 3